METSQYAITPQLSTAVPRIHTWVPSSPWIQENPGATNGVIGNPITFIHPSPCYYTTSPYYRAPDGQSSVYQSLAPELGTAEVSPSVPQQHQSIEITSRDNGGRTPKEEKPPDPGPNLTASIPEVNHQEEENNDFCAAARTPQTQFSGNFDDTELSAAVKKALQVVLSFDPTLNSTATKSDREVQKMVSPFWGYAAKITSKLSQDDVGFKAEVTTLTEGKRSDCQPSYGFYDKNTEGEADSAANDYIFHVRILNLEDTNAIHNFH